MKTFYRIIGSSFLLGMVPVSIFWVWNLQLWVPCLLTDLILLVGGLFTTSAASVETSPNKKENALKNVTFHSN